MGSVSTVFEDDELSGEILKQMNEYRKEPDHKFCDWVLESNDGVSFPVHKIVVASACPFFSALFNTTLSETKQKNMVLKNISGQSLDQLIEYMYSGKIYITAENMTETFENASYLLLKSLQNFIADFLELNINDGSCLNLWRFAEKNLCEKLSEKCVNYILKNGEKLFTPSFFLTLKFEEIMHLLKEDSLQCLEETICRRVIEWIKNDYKNREKYSKELFDEIRFPLLSDGFMLSFIYENDLLKKNEIFSQKIHETSKIKLKLSQNHFVLNKSTTTRYGSDDDREIFTVYGGTCSMFSDGEFSEKCSLKNEYNKSAATIFKNNLFVCGGKEDEGDKCQFFCPLQNTWKYFPPMKFRRSCHGVAFLRDKIYACFGGETNSFEYFDLFSERWVEKMLLTIKSNFGICVKDDCIYIVGGSSKCIDRFDWREGKWMKILAECNDFSKASVYENSLLCMTKKGGKFFDIRQMKWNEISIPGFCPQDVHEYDIWVEGNIIYLHGVYIHSAYYKDYRRILRSYTIGESTDWLVMNDKQIPNLSSPAICMMYY